ncbi:MAG: NADH-quinone oxidoreductase subunit N, partial [Planctomycetota bacterium]
RASEAGLKYIIFGSVCSGAMLFGLTLLFGIAGTTDMNVLATTLTAEGASPAAIVAAVLVLAGIGFKVSAAPFHFWAPDAYDGATTPVAGFLAVASKAAGFAILVRIIGSWMGEAHPLPEGTQFGFLPTGPLPYWILGVLAILTMIVGNTAALRQRELKRLMAWSSVSHAGYMLMTLSAGGGDAIGGVLFYFWIYLLMTIGAFGIIGLLEKPLGGTHVRHYNGLVYRNWPLAAFLGVLMISLTGLPPTLGFWGKVMLFGPVIEGGYYGLAIVGLLTSAISLFYYAFLLRAMFLNEPPSDAEELALPTTDWALVLVCCAPLAVMGLWGWWPGAAALLNAANNWVGVVVR